MLKYLLFSLFLISCNFSGTHNITSQKDKITSATPKDTIILYDIDNISTEGAEAEVIYINGLISKSTTTIYGCSFQAVVKYLFKKNHIEVVESRYSYKTPINEVKSMEEMELDYKISYTVDYNGKPLDTVMKDRIDIFEEFKEAVSFELK